MSARLSAAAASGAPRTFFVDRSLGKHRIPRALETLGYRVDCHHEHFPPSEFIAHITRHRVHVVYSRAVVGK